MYPKGAWFTTSPGKLKASDNPSSELEELLSVKKT